MKIKTIIGLILFAGFFVNTLFSKELIKTNKKILLFNEYHKLLDKKIPDIKKNLISVKKSEEALKGSKFIYDTNLNASAQYFRQKPYSLGSSFIIDHKSGFAPSVGMNQILPYLGTRLNLSFQYSLSDTIGTNSITNQSSTISQYQPSVSLSITQPLLYNAFGVLDKYTYKDAKYKLEIAKLSQKENNKAIYTYYKKLYYNWIMSAEVLDILKKALNNAKRIEAKTRRQVRVRLSDNDDLQKSVASRIQYQLQYEQNLLNYKKIKKEINLIIDTSKYAPDKKLFEKTFDKYNKEKIMADVKFVQTRNSRILKKNIASIKYQSSILQNKLLPELNLIGSVTQKSNADSVSSAFSNMSDTEYYVGLSMSYALGNSKAKSDLKQADLSIQELNQTYKSTNNSFDVKLKSLVSNITSYKKQHQFYKNYIKALNSQLYTERQKYKQARLNLSYLISTQNNIAATKINILTLRLSLILASLDYNDLIK